MSWRDGAEKVETHPAKSNWREGAERVDPGFGPTADGSIRNPLEVDWLGAIKKEFTKEAPPGSTSVMANPLLSVSGPRAVTAPVVATAGKGLLNAAERFATSPLPSKIQKATDVTGRVKGWIGNAAKKLTQEMPEGVASKVVDAATELAGRKAAYTNIFTGIPQGISDAALGLKGLQKGTAWALDNAPKITGKITKVLGKRPADSERIAKFYKGLSNLEKETKAFRAAESGLPYDVLDLSPRYARLGKPIAESTASYPIVPLLEKEARTGALTRAAERFADMAAPVRTAAKNLAPVAAGAAATYAALPKKGPEKWARDGAKKLGLEGEQAEKLLKSKEGKRLLIEASDLSPTAKRMKSIKEKIHREFSDVR